MSTLDRIMEQKAKNMGKAPVQNVQPATTTAPVAAKTSKVAKLSQEDKLDIANMVVAQLKGISACQVPTGPATSAPAGIVVQAPPKIVTPDMSPEEFARYCILNLRDEKQSKGIHVVFSGFNKLMKECYGETVNPRDITNQLVQSGKLKIRYVRKGAMIYLPEDFVDYDAAATGTIKVG
jgi:hypothetical protein